MKRTKLSDRKLPDYTKGEEIFNTVSHIVGVVLYGIGNKVRYMHSVFHLFVIAGSVLQFFGIIFYIL